MTLFGNIKDVFIHSSNNKSFWFVMMAGVLLPFLLLCFFNHPSADDFCYAQSAKSMGIWNSQMHWYQNWSGRYTANFLLTFNPLSVNCIIGYKIVSILLLISFVLSICFLVKEIMNKDSFDVSVLSLSVGFIFLYFLGMPSLVQGFYWLSGALTYQLANVFFVLLLLMLSKLNKSKNNFKWILSACFIGIVIIGLNETSMIELLYFSGCIGLVWSIQNKKNILLVGILMAVFLLASSCVLFAPGNIIRSSYFSGGHDAWYSVVCSAKHAIQKILQWLPSVIVFGVVFFRFFNRFDGSVFLVDKVSRSIVILYPLFIFGVLMIGFFPAYWSMGGAPPDRTINVIYFLFLLASFHYTVLLVYFLKEKGQPIHEVSFYIKLIIIYLFLYQLPVRNNFRVACVDILSGRASHYNQELTLRYSELNRMKGQHVEIKALKNTPESLFFIDIDSSNVSDWKNNCVSEYFGVRSLKVKQ